MLQSGCEKSDKVGARVGRILVYSPARSLLIKSYVLFTKLNAISIELSVLSIKLCALSVKPCVLFTKPRFHSLGTKLAV